MAAGKSSLYLTGTNDIVQALGQMTPRLEKKVLRQAMRKAAKPIQQQAQVNAPVGESAELRSLARRTALLGVALGAKASLISRAVSKTVAHAIREKKKAGSHYPGMLRDSIKVRAMKARRGAVGVVVQTRDGDYRGQTFYGAFIEYGTSKMDAQPYMRPAFDTKKDESTQVVTSEVRAGIDKVAAELRKR